MARAATIDFVTTYHVVTCYACGQSFAVDQGFYAILKRDGTTFYCPVGHPQGFTDTTAMQLTEARKALAEVERERDWAERKATRLREERDAVERSRAAIKGQVTRLRKRAQAGLCPYCQRHFSALERHVRCKHPDQPLPGESP